MAEIKFEGIADIQKKLAKNIQLEDVKRVIKHNGSQLQRKAQANADFKKGYATGQTKRSIGLEIGDNGLSAKVEPTTEYAPYLEFGTRFMEAQPFMKPAYNEQMKQFRSDLEKLMK